MDSAAMKRMRRKRRYRRLRPVQPDIFRCRHPCPIRTWMRESAILSPAHIQPFCIRVRMSDLFFRRKKVFSIYFLIVFPDPSDFSDPSDLHHNFYLPFFSLITAIFGFCDCRLK